MLKGKKIILGVTGSIAAYKSCQIVTKLIRQKADVIVIMTERAKQFITPITLQTLSGNRVVTDLWTLNSMQTVEHIALAEEADLLLIAPATANIIGKLASGIADDMLTCVALATLSPKLICPAMNKNMFENSIVQNNISELKQRGYRFVEPDIGRLASGIEGKGRLADIDKIIDEVIKILKKNDLSNKTVLITAGPTQEYFDPVRFISNPSTGKMGYALAEEAKNRGAAVILISGPTQISAPSGVVSVFVKTAEQMQKEVNKYFSKVDIVIGASAVTDFKPVKKEKIKIKKDSDSDLVLTLTKNPDILADLGKKKNNKIIVGFSAETDNLKENACKKLIQKNLDLIVANNVTQPGAGFGEDTNIVTIFDKFGNEESLPKMSKNKLAGKIFDIILKIR